MKNYLYLLLLVLISGLLLENCTCTRLCSNAMPTVNFVNFDSVQLDMVIVKVYYKDGTFGHLTDTKVYTSKALPPANTFSLVGKSIYDIDAFSDYIIEVPAISKAWRIKGITLHHDRLKTATCTSGMTYYLNDTMKEIAINTATANMPGPINIYN